MHVQIQMGKEEEMEDSCQSWDDRKSKERTELQWELETSATP